MFAHEFYDMLARAYPVDAALGEARRASSPTTTNSSGARQSSTCAPPMVASSMLRLGRQGQLHDASPTASGTGRDHTVQAQRAAQPRTPTTSQTPAEVRQPARQAQTQRLAQIYTPALAAFYAEQWDRAIGLLTEIVSERPDYEDAATKLEVRDPRDTLRLEAGMNLYGQDMDETVSPLEAGLAWTVDLASPRDFIGKAALIAHPPGRDSLVGLVLLDQGGVLRAHQTVHSVQGEGEITSGTFSPTLNRSIAFARLPAGVAPGDAVKVVVRDRQLAARVVKLPFARNGKVLVDLAP